MERSRPDRSGESQTHYVPGGTCQFSRLNAGTRLNSPVLALTSVRRADRA